jgi:hypothetical protein
MKPINLIFESRDTAGHRLWFMPPNPVGNPYEMLPAFDIVQDEEEMWLNREPGPIVGLVPDGQELIQRNFYDNKLLGFDHDWRELWGAEEGKICLLLGCGPSLKKSWPEIQCERSRPGFFTLGLNRSIRIGDLDYYYIMDRRGHPDWRVGKRKNTTLIASTACSTYGTANEYKERYWGEHGIARYKTKFTTLAANMVISMCDAMFVAYKLGAKEIWLYGCDYALSGGLHQGHFKCHQYYFDVPADEGLEIRKRLFSKSFPVQGINDSVVFVNWELVCYAAYTTTMAIMLADGGVPVRNKTPVGILWETWKDGKHTVLDSVRLRPEKVSGPGGQPSIGCLQGVREPRDEADRKDGPPVLHLAERHQP